MSGTWVTPDDVIVSIGAPGASYTDDDLTYLQLVCDSVTAVIYQWAPTLTPPPPVQDDQGRTLVALQRQPDGDPAAAACTAAIHGARKWYEKRGSSSVSGYAELGYIPSVVYDKDIQSLLRVGMMSDPIAI